MFQTLLFCYAALSIIFLSAFAYSNDFKKFFFFSEATWLLFFISLLGANLVLGNPIIAVNSFFILVFTGCEAVLMASILLVSSESVSQDTYLKSETL